MDEYDIELAVERKTNRLDKRFMTTELSQEEYDREIKAIDTWAQEQYDEHYDRMAAYAN